MSNARGISLVSIGQSKYAYQQLLTLIVFLVSKSGNLADTTCPSGMFRQDLGSPGLGEIWGKVFTSAFPWGFLVVTGN